MAGSAPSPRTSPAGAAPVVDFYLDTLEYAIGYRPRRLIGLERIALLDDWDVGALFEKAGIGFTEVHGWIGAVSANLACGGAAPVVDFYLDTLEYAIGYGIVHAD